MLVKIIDQYLLKETTKPLLFCIFALTLVLIGGHLFEFADIFIRQNVALSRVIELLIYRLPNIMVETFSISVLFATLLSLGKLVQSNEYAAIRMSGYSLQRVILPFLIIAIIVSILSFFTNEYIVPWSNHRAQNIIREEILKDPGLALEEDVFFQGGDRFFYVGKVDEEKQELHNVMVYNQSRDDSYPELVTAPRGKYTDEIWKLKKGIIYSFTDNGRIDNEIFFSELNLNVGERIKELYGRQRTPAEMDRQELGKQIELFKRSGIDVTSLLVEYHLKLALPLASFIFVIIGAPLSLFSNKGRIFGFMASLIILFLYYVLLSLTRSMGRNNIIDPFLAAWMPNLIFAGIGFILLFYQEFIQFKSR